MIIAVVAGTTLYVVTTTDESTPVELSVAPGAFADGDTLDPSIDRALFSPNGQRVAAIGDAGVGLARDGRLELVTPEGSHAVDAAWMPDSQSLLIAEGPEVTDRLTVLTLDGSTKGVAHLDPPFSVGAGNGMTVDSRGARAVVATETRDAIGGRRRVDLVLVDLPTGRVTPLTTTADANEAWPLFVDDSRVLFSRAGTERAAVVIELDLTTKIERQLSPDGETARPIGVIQRTRAVYAAGRPEGGVSVWAVGPRQGRTRLARLSGEDALVWSVDPTGSRAIATGFTVTPQGQSVARLRAVTLKAPDPG